MTLEFICKGIMILGAIILLMTQWLSAERKQAYGVLTLIGLLMILIPPVIRWFEIIRFHI